MVICEPFEKKIDKFSPCLLTSETTDVFLSLASPLLKVDFMNPETNPTVDEPDKNTLYCFCAYTMLNGREVK